MHHADVNINLLMAPCAQSLAMPWASVLSYPIQGPDEGDRIIPGVTGEMVAVAANIPRTR